MDQSTDEPDSTQSNEETACSVLQRLRCDRCSYSTTNKYYLKQHIELVHNSERKFKCPFCNYAGKRSHNLKEHLSVHSDERPYHCEHCNASFRKKGHLTNHYKMHPSLDSYKDCPFCDDFSQQGSASALYVHLRIAHEDLVGTKIYTCKLCPFASDNDKYLAIHEMTHRNPEVFFEPERYSDSMFVKPSRIPESAIILKCSECGFETPSRRTLEKHVYSKHLPDASTTVIEHNNNPASEADGKPATSSPNHSQTWYVKSSISPSEPLVSSTVTNNTHKQTGYRRHPVAVPSWAQSKKATLIPHIQEKARMNIQSTFNQIKASIDVTKRAPGTAKFVCQLCDYVTFTERAIKAHMWKHVGNQKLEYPSFQNGPLSIYDGTPLAASNFHEPTDDANKSSFVPVRPTAIAEKREIDETEAASVAKSEPDCKKSRPSGYPKLEVTRAHVAKKTNQNSSPIPSTSQLAIPTSAKLVSTKAADHLESSSPVTISDDNKPTISSPTDTMSSNSLTRSPKAIKPDQQGVKMLDEGTAGDTSEAEADGAEKTASELQSIAALLIMLGEDVEPNWKTQATDNNMPQGVTTPQNVNNDHSPTTSTATSSELNENKPKTVGICSSLLAVIEQLYESDVDSMSKLVDRIDDNKYRCKQCHYITNNHRNILKHLNTIHKKRDGLTCFLCDYKAVTPNQLYGHFQCHAKPQHKCDHCSMMFYHKTKLRIHMLREHQYPAVSPVGFICTACNTKNPLPDGWTLESSPPTFECKGCQQSIMVNEFFNSKTTKVIVNNEKELKVQAIDQKCSICGFVAINTRSMKSHLKRHENDIRYSSQPLTLYQCTLCAYVCHHAPAIKSHMWKHAGENGFSYDFMSILNENNKNDIKQSFILMKCCQCGFETTSNKNMLEHMNTHKSESISTETVHKSA